METISGIQSNEAVSPVAPAGGPPCPIITKLPADVLLYMLDNFLHLGKFSKGKIDWEELWGQQVEDPAFQTVQTLRLVCRLFHDMVSSRLCQRIRIQLDQSSLDRARALVKNPHIASGVQGVQVALPYRPEELALDISAFVQVRLADLTVMRHHMTWRTETRWLSNGQPDIDHNEFSEELQRWDKITSSWRPYENNTTQTDPDTDAPCSPASENNAEGLEEYEKILLLAHEIFRIKHHAQRNLIESGNFVNTVANIICQLPNAVALSITDRVHPRFARREFSMVKKREKLLSYLASPFDWSDLGDMRSTPRLVPARVLTELPIAIHRLGRNLQSLRIGCIPIQAHHEQLIPPTDGFSWTQLREACQELEVFQLRGTQLHNLPLREQPISPQSRQILIEFFRATLSSNKLREVDLSLYSLGRNDGRTTGRDWCSLGGIFQSTHWPHIQKLSVMDIGFSQVELERFVSTLGYGGLQSLGLVGFQLNDGSWADAIDMLRDRITARREYAPRPFVLNMAEMTGGEFGDGKSPMNNLQASIYKLEDCIDRERITLLELTKMYLVNQVSRNPIRLVD